MQKIIYSIPLLCFIVLQFSCNRYSKNKSENIKQVNYWYNRQSYFSPINTDSVFRYAKLIDSASTGLGPVYKAMALVGMGRYHAGSKINLSQKLYEEALVLLKDSGADSVMARAYNGIGVSYIRRSDYSNALDNYFKALRLFEQADDVAGMGGVLANMGEAYQLKNDIPSAKKYINRSMALNKEHDNLHSYLDAAQTMANLYGMSNQFDSAIAIDRMGIKAADSIGSAKLKSGFLNNLGNCYMYSGQPDSARYYFMQCLALDSAGGVLNYMVDNYLTLGQLSLRQKSVNEAEQYFKKAIVLSDSIKENHLKVQAWGSLALLYKQQDRLALSITAKDSATAIKDRIINEKSENKIAELQELYETEKKEQTIALQQVKLSKQNLLLIGSGILLASLFLSGWLLYRRYTIKKEKELQARLMQQREKATIDILQAEDQERRRIAAELHDGVGQVMLAAWMNLQSIESQMGSLDEAQQHALTNAISMVGEGCKEVREVSHSMMPNALLNKGLAGAVRDFTQQIDRNVISITLHTEGLDSPINEMVETILYRVIQELVNNAIKHAEAGELDIAIVNNKNGITLLIEDNGKGFNTTAVMNGDTSNDGLGLQNIKSRIAFLHGNVEWDSSPGNGTVVTIFIPAKNEHV